jgi:hypothetical protein
MINWENLDQRLAIIGKDRAWLAEHTPYSLDSIRNAMAPNSKRRSDKMLAALRRLISDEEQRFKAGEKAPGVFDIFLTEEALHKADRASRIVGAPSLADFCRDVIDSEAERILAREAAPKGQPDDATGSGDAPDPAKSELGLVAEDPGNYRAGAATPGDSSPSPRTKDSA